MKKDMGASTMVDICPLPVRRSCYGGFSHALSCVGDLYVAYPTMVTCHHMVKEACTEYSTFRPVHRYKFEAGHS